MKYAVVLGDGMADYPIPELGGKTPLMAAKKPNMDELASRGETGMVKTIPDGVPPGSDAANLSVMGYDPRLYYTGRSPLEAVSMGVAMVDTDVAFRCNLVTLAGDGPFEDRVMEDYSSDEISTSEAHKIIEAVNAHYKDEVFTFHPGISYRHCLIWKNGPTGSQLTPPHDILEKKIGAYLPKGPGAEPLLRMMRQSSAFLANHPVNRERIKNGLRPANTIWLWGEGKRPSLPDFNKKYSLSGSVVSAVDLIKGIGICAGLNSVEVEGVTGNYKTNFKGKAEAALSEFESGRDFVYIHVEAPDECGHRYEINHKVRSIELIDELVLGTLRKGLEKFGEYCIMVLPDHPTPLSLRTHTAEPVPYLIYRSKSDKPSPVSGYDEIQAKTGPFIENGYTIMDRFFNNV